MIKTFLNLIMISTLVSASQQIILVTAYDSLTKKARLQCYEGGKKVFSSIDVNIGKSGLGWGLGEIRMSLNSSINDKKEGDKKAPIGIFKLTSLFGVTKSNKYKMFFQETNSSLICVDDSNSRHYNKIIQMPLNKPKSFEYMQRKDIQYKLGIVVAHNKDAIAQRGSCIFIHVQKGENMGTAGCTSMEYNDLEKIALWLDSKKDPILIQIPKSSYNEVLELYPQLEDKED